jgi:hypothetical protein
VSAIEPYLDELFDQLAGTGSAGRRILMEASVEAELVALDVLHHQARLVLLVGQQQPHADRAERDSAGALGLEHGQALLAHEPGADPHVEVHPVLDDLALGDALEEQPRAHTRGIGAGERRP